MKFKKSVFVFRRDHRIQDNRGLIQALKNSETVLPLFIFDKRQIEKNEFKSEKAVAFMIESLLDLEGQIKEKGGALSFLEGTAEEEIEKLIKQEKIEAVFFNNDYTPFSIKRDEKIKEMCEKHNVKCLSFDDALLNKPGKITKDDGAHYTIYTPYKNKVRSKDAFDPPEKNTHKNYAKKKIAGSLNPKKFYTEQKNALFKGGRTKALEILKNLKQYDNYDEDRNIPNIEKTTHLSAYLKFGCISPRELFLEITKQLDKGHTLIDQLIWRDFYYQIAFFNQEVFGTSFKKEYDNLKWENNKEHFKAWTQGKTGFPIVDAGMRQLNETGYMHNRVRMIVASFLVKDLHIDWRWGEKYFAQKLIDYDPCLNNGNWQWAASTGCDAQPYFRIFNPWLQQKKFDPDAKYIKKWIPELNDMPLKKIHEENDEYISPIVDHRTESKKAIEYFKQCRS